jgi:phosphomannomutase
MIQNRRDDLLFSVAGARGIVGRGMTIDTAVRLTLAFCPRLPAGPVVVGRDTRPSGESLESGVIGAITATGRECVDLGIATTPTVEMMVEKLGAAGGVIVTASHNPVEWNALKFLDSRGIFISKSKGDDVYDAFINERFEYCDARSTGKVRRYHQSVRDHIEAVLALPILDVSLIRRRAFRVVIDPINGAGSVIAPDFLRALGATVVPINCKTDGDFYRDPEPRAENLGELAEKVKNEKADLGFALDPDADRLGIVDETGTVVGEEYTLALAIDQVLGVERKGPVVVNLSTSAVVDWIADRHGVDVVRTPVGEAHVVEAMLSQGAVIGGEGNGGVIYPTLHPGRDGVLGMALILQLLASSKATLGRRVGQYPAFHMSKSKVKWDTEFSVKRISGLIRELGPAKIDAQDGVKAIFDDGWFHLRVSNTEGVVRILAESMAPQRTKELVGTAGEILAASRRPAA